MSSESLQSSFIKDAEHGLSDRNWAISRIDAWVSDLEGTPAFLVRGNPGSGKSTLLVQYLARLEAGESVNRPMPRVIAAVLRHPRFQQPFDAVHLLVNVANGLANFAPVINVSLPAPPAPNINVNITVGEADKVTGVILQQPGISSISGLLAMAEQRVRATPKTERAVIVIDALDQAEDEAADEFLRAVAALVRAADGTGVRILCTSRTRIPVWLDPSKRLDMDLVEDAGDLNSELRAYLQDRFADLSSLDRNRVVDALLNGAQGNWLWASTNANALEDEIAKLNTVPRHINLSRGLAGLYGDGWRRISRRVATQVAEARVKRILGAVACSFTGSLGLAELRWVTDVELDEIKQLVRACEPFLIFDQANNVRVFHPDFSRWLFSADEVGLSEQSEHLRLARGLTRFGKTMHWRGTACRYAASWVLNHWCSILILDPLRPDAEELEKELTQVIADPDWGNSAGSSLETIEQLGFVAPRLRLPNHSFPLLAALRALQASPSVTQYVWCRILESLQEEQTTELFAIKEGRREWLEQHIPDFSSIMSQAIWGGFLSGRFVIKQADAGIIATLRPSAVLDTLDSSGDRVGYLSSFMSQLATEVPQEDGPALLDGLQALLQRKPSRWAVVAKVNRILGQVYRARNAEDSGEKYAEDLALVVAAYTEAWQALPPGHDNRLDFAIDLANALRDLPARSAEQLALLITAQAEIRDLRRSADDSSWPGSANRLGDAYKERAEGQADQDAREEDLTQAVAAYAEAWQAVPPGHQSRLDYAIGLANALRDLPARSAEQLALLITAQAEIRDLRRSADDSNWPGSANRLGDAYKERAEGQADQDAREEDLTQAVAAYTEAWQALPPGHESRLDYAIGLANALLALPARSAERLALLIIAQAEIRDLRRSADDPLWPQAANLLGDAYRERAEGRTDQGAREGDLTLVVAAYAEAWQAVPPDHDHRLDYAIGLANALRDLPARSAEQRALLVTAQAEIRDLRRSADDSNWPGSANLLGDAYKERAEGRADQGAREEDLTLAVAAYDEAWQALPPGHESRLGFAIGLANALLDLPARSAEQLALLITVQAEIRDQLRSADDPQWPKVANLLGDAYRERAEGRADQGAREEDLALAVAACTEAWQAVPPGHDNRLGFAIGLANALLDLPARSAEQLALLIIAQAEIRDLRRSADDPLWPQAANLLGNAYKERAEGRADQDAPDEEDLTLAAAAYTEAWQGVPPGHESRLGFAIGLANTLLDLPARSAEQLALLITVQAEIRDRLRSADDPQWPKVANLLGDTYRERAKGRADQGAREEDLTLAVAAYTEAWQALPSGHESRLDFAIDLANTLLALPARSAEQLALLITAQAEIRDLRRSADDPLWPQAANLLGDAYRERAKARADQVAREEEDLALAVAAYTEAWQALPSGHESRLGFAIGLANALLALPARSAEQLALLIIAQAEIRDLRRSADDPLWPQAANLLGDTYKERAEGRADQDAREEDLTLAVAAYNEAWQALPPGHDNRLGFAIDLANALVVQAAIQPAGELDGREVVDRALDLVSSEITDRELDNLTELRRLLPVLSVQLRRQQWSWI